MKNSISNKLAYGFGFSVLLMIAIFVFNILGLQKLEKLNRVCVQRALAMELATDAQHIGEDQYMIISNSMVNRNLAKNGQMWVDEKIENLAKLQNVSLYANTPEDQSKIREARKAFEGIIRIYEQEMLPLLKKGSGVTARLAEIDARIDRKIEVINMALQWVAQSMSNENQRVSMEFHNVLSSTIRSGFIISLIGLLVAILISTLTTRQIVRPLSTITRAAMEMEKGNYLVELKHRSEDEIGILFNAFRNMSEKVERHTFELEQRVEQRTAELSESNAQLEQEIVKQKQLELQLFESKKLESIGQLAGGVAHEVRNPLNAILSISEALFREQEIEGNPEYEPYLQHIRTQVGRLAHLMNDLLDLGKQIPASSLYPASLYELCMESVKLWKSSGSAENRLEIILVSDHESARAQVLADSMKLQQVFFNLLENASQHSPKGSEILLHLLAPDEAGSADGMAIVRITDKGSGIPADRIARIFEPFYSNRKGGTGLGLALVKHFVEHMGGVVLIWNNDPPPGCTAEVRIPLAGEDRV
jgi:signal transduction histidine kinase